MTYSRFPVFKTGYNASPRTFINPQALTPTQKMELARNRIWGNYVGGNSRSGYKELKRAWSGRTRDLYYEFANLRMLYPFISKWEDQNKKKEKYEERKTRIFMRGIKIGAKRGGDSKSGMSLFEQNAKAGEKQIAKVAKEAEKAAKN